MSFSVDRIRAAESCEALVRDTNAFIACAYTRENTIVRRNYVYEYSGTQSFAMALHCPGSPRTRHLPGFELGELPASLAELTCEVVARMGVGRGRVLFNVGRYAEHLGEIAPHYDGELFDYSVRPGGAGSDVDRALRPRTVAILTLRDETATGGTCLHDADGNVVQPSVRRGDLLRFDNTVFMHSAPDPVISQEAPAMPGTPRWIRYILGWRALDDDCFFWQDGRPLVPVDFEEAIALHERFLAEDWPRQMDSHLARATFPFPEAYS